MKAFLRYSDSSGIRAIVRFAATVRAGFALSRQEASQPKALLTIAGALADLRGLAIGMAAAFFILFLRRGTI